MQNCSMKKSPDASYTFNIEAQILKVCLFGSWNLSADIQYLQGLSEHIDKVNCAPWGMLVDMRNWQLRPATDNMFGQSVANIHLDRRNQLFECWVVNTFDQASELQPFIESVPNLRFKRFYEHEQALDWIKHFNL